MEEKKYKIQNGDTLEKIAEIHFVSIEELVSFHNANCGITQQITSNVIPFHLTSLFVEFNANNFDKKRKISVAHKKGRYRTKQINIVKIDDIISTHTTVRCEYLVSINSNSAKVTLEDSIYNFYADGTKDLETFIRTSDTLKKDISYQLGKNGEIVDILNKENLQQNWHRFKKQLPLNNLVKNAKPEVLNQLLNAGNSEFNSSEILLKNCKNNLFNQIIFSQYLTKSLEDFEREQFETVSHLFPQIGFTVECETTLRNHTESQTNYLKKGKPLFVDIDKMILQYEEYYKRQIQYKFTDHLYDYDVYFSVSNEDNMIDEATLHLSEKIKNNIESQVIYQLKRIEL